MLYAFIIVLFVLLCFFALYNKTVIRRYEIETKKIKNDIKILLVSDLHSVYQKNNFEKLFKMINGENPDLIVLCGDIFDAKRKDDGAIAFLKELKKLKNLKKDIKSFYVAGNHETRRTDTERLIKTVKENNIIVLNDEKKYISVNSNDICMCGISDIYTRMKTGKKAAIKNMILNKFSDCGDGFNILLAHSPFYIDEYLSADFDLVISGHTHGGQFRIPVVMNGFYNRSGGFFPKYCGGLYKKGNASLVVGRGISASPRFVPRVFNRKEIVLIKIKKER